MPLDRGCLIGKDARKSVVALAHVVLHDALFFALPVFVARGIALVMQFFTAPQAAIQLDPAILVVQVQGYERIAALLAFSDHLADFLALEQHDTVVPLVWQAYF